MRTKRTLDSVPVETCQYDIKMTICVRAPVRHPLPGKKDVEDKIADLLLAQPRLSDGANWDVSSTSIPEGCDR